MYKVCWRECSRSELSYYEFLRGNLDQGRYLFTFFLFIPKYTCVATLYALSSCRV